MRANHVAFILVSLLATLAAATPLAAQEINVAVVVNQDNKLTTLTLAELRKVFLGERRSWAVGLPIKLIVTYPGTPERATLLKLLGMSEGEYKQYWIAQIFRGEAESEPISVPSIGMQMEALNVFAGAITFVSMQNIKPGMKVIKVDGHLPGNSSYPIH